MKRAEFCRSHGLSLNTLDRHLKKQATSALPRRRRRWQAEPFGRGGAFHSYGDRCGG
jgi:hypothetical protein